MAGTQPAIDLKDQAFLQNPYPTYARLRTESPVVLEPRLGWIVARHGDISALLHDPRLKSGPLNEALYASLPEAAAAAIVPFRDAMSHNMLWQDPPDHSRLRRLVSQAFTPRRIETLRVTIQRIADELLDAAHPGERFDSPAQLVWRFADEDIAVGDRTITGETVVLLLLGSGNRDPEAFPDPDRLDLTRHPRHYLSFGTGSHACLGAFLARLEGEIALPTLLRRFPNLALADQSLCFRPNPVFRGLEQLPVTL